MVETARGVLGMEMGFISDTREGRQAYKVVTGDGGSFSACAGESVPLEGTYCHAMLEGRLGNVVRDSSLEPLVAELPITHESAIGSYIGVPIVLPDGQLFGTLCCLSHHPTPTLGSQQVEMMGLLAGLIGEQIEYERLRSAEHAGEILDGTVGALIASLELRDGYTEEHSHAVVGLALAIGERLGLSAEELGDLRIVAVLHDIGKLGIPDAILRKPGALSDQEWVQMRRHPEIGANLVASMRPIAHLAPVIHAEHERWDGRGYPHGLATEEIPIGARIVLIADAFHAMTSDRPYRRAMSREDACAELAQHSGTQFWPTGVAAALAILAGSGAESTSPRISRCVHKASAHARHLAA